MLTRTEAADIPQELAQQRTIASLGLAINQYVKTLQGRQMIETMEHFALNGKLYQGFNQRAVECTENLLTPEEIDAIHDVDGTKQRILDTRARRLEGAAQAKRRELATRRQAVIATERDALELRKLLREEAAHLKADGAFDPDDPEPGSEPEAEPEPEILACPSCGKQFNSKRGLNAHKMGAKH